MGACLPAPAPRRPPRTPRCIIDALAAFLRTAGDELGRSRDAGTKLLELIREAENDVTELKSHVLSGGQDKKWTVFTWDHDGAADAPYPTNPRVKDATVNDDQGNHRRTSVSYQPFTPPVGGAVTLPQEVTEYKADASNEYS